jgi:DNA-binding LacI/PurR family transcriptional regulator
MAEYSKLYGKSIIPGLRLNRLQQVSDILREEIQSGRWQINDRMPAVSELVEKTSLSRGSIQQVFKMLEKEGYIQCEERKGTFLASTMPRDKNVAAKIGVAMVKEDPNDANPPFIFQLHWIFEEAKKQHLGVKVIYFDKDCAPDSIDLVNGPFGKEVKGILTPYPFHRPLFNDQPPDRIPLVFVGPHMVDSLPFVCGDTWYGTYHLTKKVIEAGHKNIIACCRPGELPIETELFLKGYRAAMKESGLEVNEEAIEDSLSIPLGNLPQIKKHLEKYNDVTAIVSSLYIRSRNLVSVCDLIGKKVPEDISIVSRDSSPMRLENPDEVFTCFEYETRKAVATAFDILRELIETGTCKFSRVMIPPTLKEGQSLRSLQ